MNGRRETSVWCVLPGGSPRSELLEGFWQSEDPERARRLAANAENGDRVAAAMLNTASRSQREHMRAKLGDIERDVLRMISRATRP